MSRLTPTRVTIQPEEIAGGTPGNLRVVDNLPGLETWFYTVTLTGGTYQLSDPFTTGDIEAVAPGIRVVSRSDPTTEYQELEELAQYNPAVARLEQLGMPTQFDFTDILEP